MAAEERLDAAILDPPRKGAEAALLNAIADAGIPRIAYVSCNPSTLARDVKLLTERGYRLDWAQPVDMFPWTEHVRIQRVEERIVRLPRLDSFGAIGDTGCKSAWGASVGLEAAIVPDGSCDTNGFLFSDHHNR